MRIFLAVVGCLLFLGAASSKPAVRLELVRERPVPEPVGRISDLRWAGDDSLYLAAGPAGVLRVKIEPDWGQPQVVLPADESLWAAARLGASSSYVAAGAPGQIVAWRRLPAQPVQTFPLDTVVDLDVYEDRIALLGARKDERGRYAPDGAIAWVGSFEKVTELRPVRYSVLGPGARSMDSCGPFEIGAVRFLANGSLLVVPGSEPGIFLLDPAGKLQRSWEAKDLGMDAGCGLSEEQTQQLSGDLRARAAWVNQRRVLDDIVVLPEGAGLFVRTSAGGVTRWDLHVLRPDGTVSSLPVPFSGSSPHWHLRADVRGRRLAVLLKEYAVDAPPAPSRILFFELSA